MKNNSDNRTDKKRSRAFVNAEQFNDYNVPVPDSMRKKKRKKAKQQPSARSETAAMPELREAQRKREIQKQHMEELEYVRRAEIARQEEAQRHKRMQELLRQRELEQQQKTSDEPDEYQRSQGRITFTSMPPSEREQPENVQPQDDYEQDEMLFQAYDDDSPSFQYLDMKDGKITPADEQTQDEEDEDEAARRDREKNISQQITPESAYVTDIREERKKAKAKKLAKRLVVLFIIAAVGIAAYITSSKWIPKLEGLFDKPHETIVNDGKEEGGNFPLKISQSGISSITQCDDIMVTLDGRRVVFYEPDGTQIKAIAHNYGSPMIDVSEKKILAYDNSGRSFQVMTRKGSVYTKKTDDPIMLAKIAPNGFVAVVTQTEKYAGFLTVYDETGSVVYTWAGGKRIVDICFTEEGKGCCISTISSSGGKIDSTVYSVMFDSKDTVMSCTVEDSLVLRAQKMKNGDYWLVCDDSLVKVNSGGDLVSSYEFADELTSMCTGEKYVAIYTSAVTGTHGTLLIFDCTDEKNGPNVTQDISGKPHKLQMKDSTVIAFSSSLVESYDAGGSKLATAAVSRSYVDCVYANKAVYLMGYRDINKIKFDT